MPDPTPSAEDAQTAVEQAVRHADRLRLEEQPLRLVLVVVAIVYVAAGFLLAIPRLAQPGISPALTLVGLIGGGIAVCVVLLRRMRAATRRGMVRYFRSIAAFATWNAAVMAVSVATGWWGFGMPGYHFTVSAVVAALPLVVAAALMGPHRR